MIEFDSNSQDESIKGMSSNIDDFPPPPSKIKRPLNAYNLFYLERQPKLKIENPLLNGNDISKLVAQEWKEMSDIAKRPFVDQAQNLYSKFKEENPDYHYEKNPTKKNNKKKVQKELIASTNYQQSVNKSLFEIGAIALAQIILSRKDLQDEVFRMITNIKPILDNNNNQFYDQTQQNPPQIQQQQQQLILPPQPPPTPQQFDQTSHFDPLVSEID